MELYEIPSVFMDTKESLQRLKMRDKTRGCRADGRRIRQLWRRGRKCESLQANDLYAIIRRSRWRGSPVRLCNAVCLEKASIHCQKSRFTIRLLTKSSWAPAALKKVCVCVEGGDLFLFTNDDWIAKEQRLFASANPWMNRFFSPTAKAVSVWLNNLPNAVESIPRDISEPVTLMDWAIKSLSKGGRATLRLKITSLLLVD